MSLRLSGYTIVHKISILALGLLLMGAIFVNTGIAAEGYEMLFKGITSKLSKKEKQQIYKQLGFRLSKDKKLIVDGTCGDVSPRSRSRRLECRRGG